MPLSDMSYTLDNLLFTQILYMPSSDILLRYTFQPYEARYLRSSFL